MNGEATRQGKAETPKKWATEHLSRLFLEQGSSQKNELKITIVTHHKYFFFFSFYLIGGSCISISLPVFPFWFISYLSPLNLFLCFYSAGSDAFLVNACTHPFRSSRCNIVCKMSMCEFCTRIWLKVANWMKIHPLSSGSSKSAITHIQPYTYIAQTECCTRCDYRKISTRFVWCLCVSGTQTISIFRFSPHTLASSPQQNII